jgi:hypothetical protein
MDQLAERAAWRRPTIYVAAAVALAAGTGIAGYALLQRDDKATLKVTAVATPAKPAALDPVEAHLAFLAERRDELCRCAPGDAACARAVMETVNRRPRPQRFLDPGEKMRARTLMDQVLACARNATSPPATIQLRLPSGVKGTPWVDGVKLAVGPVADGFEHKLAPGKHTIAVLVADGRGCEVDVELAERERRDVTCTPTPPSSEPVNAPPSVIEAYRVTGNKNIFPDDETKAAISAGSGRAIGSFKLCLDASGAVTTVKELKSTGFRAYDDEIMRQMREWTYLPFAPDGNAMPVCTAVTFIFSAQ